MDFIWRYQAVYQEHNGTADVGVYEVAIDDTTGDILYLLTEDPIELRGESLDEIMHILHHVQKDIKEFGIITHKQLQEDIRRANSKFEDAFTSTNVMTEPISEEEWTELFNGDDVSDLLDEQFDDDGNVIDLVDFMKRNR